MNPRSITVLILLATASCNSPPQRNLLLIVADDLGLEPSIYGNSACPTPHLERLAARSTLFLNAFTSVSSCSPSRASIMSGLPCHENGMYGLHHDTHHFNAFDQVRSISQLMMDNRIKSGIIGKKHVGPEYVFPFDYSVTEEGHSILQVGRNITLIKQLVDKYLDMVEDNPFFLYIGLHDAHRCGHSHPELGSFCQEFGVNGTIVDWKPVDFDPDQVTVPYYVADTPVTRRDIANQYKTISRLDQGIGLILEQLKSRGLLSETLVIVTSDNGSPFASGRTNLYDPGLRIPLLVSRPDDRSGWNTTTSVSATLLDLFPTICDWFEIPVKGYRINNRNVTLTGRSLLPLVSEVTKEGHDLEDQEVTFASHVTHEVTMYYPMRSARSSNYKLIHNLNFWAPFLIDQDFYLSPTFQDILNRTQSGTTTFWNKNLTNYYFRPEFEFFNLSSDRAELIALNCDEFAVCGQLKLRLESWQRQTNDPWLCSPHSVLQDSGQYRVDPICMPLYN